MGANPSREQDGYVCITHEELNKYKMLYSDCEKGFKMSSELNQKLRNEIGLLEQELRLEKRTAKRLSLI